MARKKAIVFIDGNNLYHNLKQSYVKPSSIHLEKLSDAICEHYTCQRVKTIYYNSIPSIADGEETYYKHLKFLDSVKKFQRFEVKTRKLQRNSTQERLQIMNQELKSLGLCSTCLPIIKTHWNDYIGSVDKKEKGVDVLIAVDMIELGLVKKEAEMCILLSGDADFIPALDVLNSNNIEVGSASMAKGYSFDLRQKHKWFILDKQFIIKNCSRQ